jgi:hypothetical protein
MHEPSKIVGMPPDGQLPVYIQDWFTDIAGRGEEIKQISVNEDGRPVGRLTIIITRNGLGMKQGYNLPWARLCGLVIREGISEKQRAQTARQLIRQLPTDVSYFLTLANKSDYELFLAEGFQPALEDNYAISVARFRMLPQFSKRIRYDIRQAERELVVSTATATAFIKTYELDLLRKVLRPYAPLEIARDILEEGLRRNQARVFTAIKRDTGEIDAALACLWDHDQYYYWMSTRRPATKGESKPNQGALKLVLWSAIQDAAARGLNFDFDGVGTGPSNQRGKSQLYERLGAEPCIRYRVKRETPLERILGRSREPVKLVIRKIFGRFIALRF